jgi:hypothetical protein
MLKARKCAAWARASSGFVLDISTQTASGLSAFCKAASSKIKATVGPSDTIEMIISAFLTASAALVATCTPKPDSPIAFSADLFQALRVIPLADKFLAIGNPIRPVPRNATFDISDMASSFCSFHRHNRDEISDVTQDLQVVVAAFRNC